MGNDDFVHGSGNVWEDFGYADADMRQAKGQLAARIIAALDQRQLTTRRAHELTGFAAADFSRVRNADYGRFTLDRMIRMLHALDAEVEVRIAFERRVHAPQPSHHLERT
ncbi:Predicted DNA-binding protein, contains XRE-type HTH domain [Methylobacterium sp. 174MFSha1.1]|uniref:helix-turn-helix domain-containing protein n=1 Tax=Methylobacterium sp. 174MFSha1.1 TaxID=1502749 RepID=UPI0008E4D521|nr:helix-turn-helix transcriptional regulator [Methylobacterium sp. 174MFSha1.1]SFV16336.1 Predicted DNA-binding protein, contains XRE-type HTH domain [Methylobacterium sp. 174MFSha1.1]